MKLKINKMEHNGTYLERQGDLLENLGDLDIVVHGCNCFCTMGKGIAKSIKSRFPGAYLADTLTEKGNIDKLGTWSQWFDIESETLILNAYTQYQYHKVPGTPGNLFRYDKFTEICRSINKTWPGSKIGLPKIGAGLAGGDWDKIKEIIKTELRDCHVTVFWL